MKQKVKNKESRKKRAFCLCAILFFLFSFKMSSQDSIAAAKDLSEEKELQFQEFFFKALSDKSIGNHQKAIENLESCNQILPKNTAVYFEFSKNYLLLKNTLLAKEYIQRALVEEPDNRWMLKHLVNINLKDRSFDEAIHIQQKIAVINPKERELLIKLLLQNNQVKKAISLLQVLADENVLSTKLKRLKERLEAPKKETVIVAETTSDLTALIHQFKTEKSYEILKYILQKSTNNTSLLKFAEEGVLLFPAQPYVYLTKGKVLNYQKNYKKALLSLQNGLDFVIEDTMESSFYNEMAISCRGLGMLNEEKKFRKRIENLKN